VRVRVAVAVVAVRASRACRVLGSVSARRPAALGRLVRVPVAVRVPMAVAVPVPVRVRVPVPVDVVENVVEIVVCVDQNGRSEEQEARRQQDKHDTQKTHHDRPRLSKCRSHLKQNRPNAWRRRRPTPTTPLCSWT